METKTFEPEDPMELVGFSAPALTEADIVEMTESIVDEYMRLGWEDAEILSLFRHPNYPITHALYRMHGEGFVVSAVRRVRERWGDLWRFRDKVTDNSPDDLEAIEDDTLIPLDAVGLCRQ